MDPLTAVAATLVGYLCGSVSFPHLFTRWLGPRTAPGQASPGPDLEVPIVGTDETVPMTHFGAYAAAMVLGPKAGVVISLLDMLKVAVPVLAFRLYLPGRPYHLFSAVAGLVGHIWPLYHRFKGGRGFTAILGGFLVVDWLGVPVTIAAGILIGAVLFQDMLAAYSAWLPLMIPWLWLRTHDPAYVLYAVALNLIFFLATLPEARSFLRMRREGKLDGYMQGQMQFSPMWRGMADITRRLRLKR